VLTLIGKGLQLCLGAALGLYVLALVVGWLGAYPNLRSDLNFNRPPTSTAEGTAQLAAGQAVGALNVSNARVEFFWPANVTIYMERPAYEGVPFPDRSAYLANAAQPWCRGMDKNWFPLVMIADVRTGERIETFSCVSGVESIKVRQKTVWAVFIAFWGLVAFGQLLGRWAGRGRSQQ